MNSRPIPAKSRKRARYIRHDRGRSGRARDGGSVVAACGATRWSASRDRHERQQRGDRDTTRSDVSTAASGWGRSGRWRTRAGAPPNAPRTRARGTRGRRRRGRSGSWRRAQEGAGAPGSVHPVLCRPGNGRQSRGGAPLWSPKVTALSATERTGRGRSARRKAPRSSHGRWEPAPDRPDPVSLLEEQAATRVPELVPIRYGRMLVSPFTFYRGAALDHGGRPGVDPGLGDHRAAVRGCAPVELRALRHPGAAADLRHQRLRRDAAGPVGVGRQADGGELRDHGPLPRLLAPATGARSSRPGCASTGSGCAGPPSIGDAATSWYDHLEADASSTRSASR